MQNRSTLRAPQSASNLVSRSCGQLPPSSSGALSTYIRRYFIWPSPTREFIIIIIYFKSCLNFFLPFSDPSNGRFLIDKKKIEARFEIKENKKKMNPTLLLNHHPQWCSITTHDHKRISACIYWCFLLLLLLLLLWLKLILVLMNDMKMCVPSLHYWMCGFCKRV